MKSIEEIKIELTLKMLSGKILWSDIDRLPVNDELRTFVCSLGPKYARWYAGYVDRRVHPETQWECSKDRQASRWYNVTFMLALKWGDTYHP